MRHKEDVILPLHPEGAAVGMSLGDSVRVTLFGESHGAAVGALLEGVPPGLPIDVETLIEDLARRTVWRLRGSDDRVSNPALGP